MAKLPEVFAAIALVEDAAFNHGAAVTAEALSRNMDGVTEDTKKDMQATKMNWAEKLTARRTALSRMLRKHYL